MGGWSYDDYMDAPVDWTEAIVHLMEREAENLARISKKGKGSTYEPHRGEQEPIQYERVRTASGIIKTRRKLTAGDKVLHSMFGAPPARKR